MISDNVHRFLAGVLAGLVLAGVVVPPAAAQLQRLPGAAEPGLQPPERLAPPPPVALEWSVQLPPGAEPPEALKAETLDLADVKLTGVTVYRAEQLAGLFAPYRGKQITFEQFYAIARAVQQRYREDGYVLSFAYVPPQTVEDGIFTIAVVEGFVERVPVEDVEEPLKRNLEALLAPISAHRPLDVRTLERYLLLANDMAGLKVTGVLRPSGSLRGAAVLVAKVRRNPVEGGATVDNRGSEFTGTWQSSVSASVNSAFGTGERLSLSLSEASLRHEKEAVSASYQQPIGNDGLRFEQTVSYTTTTPGSTLKEFDVKTKTLELGTALSYPLIRSRAETLTASAGLTVRNSTVVLRNAHFSRDRYRFLNAGLNYSTSGFLGGSSRIALGLTQAFPILGETDPERITTSRADANPYFTTGSLDIVHAQPLPGGFELRLAATAQRARSPVPASVEFSLGGADYGRAYNSGEITGEDGAALSAEFSYLSDWKIPGIQYVTPYAFYDVGTAWDRSSASSTGGKASLASAGFGVRAGLPFGFTLRFEYAHPLTREPSNQTGEDHGRYFVFASWTY